MGLFDKIFGRGASKTVAKPDAQQRFNQLKQKYHTALTVADQQGVRLTNLHMQGDKLYIKGTAPSEDTKNKVWDQIKLSDPTFADLTADITVAQQNGNGQAANGQVANGQTKSYTVKSGDTLSKISREFYGDDDEYMRIFYANRDKLNDPDKIQIGQQLVIPADDDA